MKEIDTIIKIWYYLYSLKSRKNTSCFIIDSIVII
jgi:hypothetical protein